MSDPVTAKAGPYVLDMKPGTYWWCSCGRSAKQPFCDGAHRGSEFKPEKVVIETQETVPWCGCKRSGNGPRCDGTHRKL